MSLILNIDTATETGSVCLSKDGELLSQQVSSEQKDHASWIQGAVQELLQEAGCTMRDVQAVGVTAGPGSYTGLRVGMSTAKGYCYTLGIPLITENTLKVMAFAAREEVLLTLDAWERPKTLFCPMIDARRMEVFTALYDARLTEILPPAALVLDHSTFKEALNSNVVLFTGSGIGKWKHLCIHPNARYADGNPVLAPFLAKITAGLFLQRQFADLAYASPVYLKEFYSHNKK